MDFAERQGTAEFSGQWMVCRYVAFAGTRLVFGYSARIVGSAGGLLVKVHRKTGINGDSLLGLRCHYGIDGRREEGIVCSQMII